MFEPEINDFFDSFNKILSESFNLGDSQTLVEAQTGVQDEKKDGEKPEDLFEPPDNILIGDMLKPCFAITGELLGFKVQPNMAQQIMFDSSFEITHLKRIVKICIHFNKMFQFGRDDDFILK